MVFLCLVWNMATVPVVSVFVAASESKWWTYYMHWKKNTAFGEEEKCYRKWLRQISAVFALSSQQMRKIGHSSVQGARIAFVKGMRQLETCDLSLYTAKVNSHLLVLLQVCMYVLMYVCMYVCMRVYFDVCILVYMYVFIFCRHFAWFFNLNLLWWVPF